MTELENLKTDLYSLSNTIAFLRSKTELLENALAQSMSESAMLAESLQRSETVLIQQTESLRAASEELNSLSRRCQLFSIGLKTLAGISAGLVVLLVVK